MGKINYIIRLWNTVRFLKLLQIYSRLKLLIKKRNSYSNKITNYDYRNIHLIKVIDKNQSLFKKEEFIFFNLKGNLKDIGWQNESQNKLWRYNQNYLDDLNSKNANLKIEIHIDILKNWIENNKDINLLPWDPYPTSLRIVNIIKWITRNSIDNIIIKKIIKSLAFQSEHLYQNIEYHLMGNHLFTNAKALIFTGLFFDTPRSKLWANKGFNLMKSQLREQILNDGGHFERSPMYHAIILEDVLDVFNIINNNNTKDIDVNINWLLMLVKKMIIWMIAMNHPDKNISFFNDCAFNISSKSEDIIDYAKRLNVINEKEISKINNLFNCRNSEIPSFRHLSDSGYIALFSTNAYLIADVAKIGPDYIPSHAHADTLSYELSLFNKRVIVNSGTSTYENNKIRYIERSTKSHSTVELNNTNSSDVWSAFRVGKRAEPKKLEILDNKNFVKISCSHNGYSNLNKKILHNRVWIMYGNNSLKIKDTIDGNILSGIARHILHPEIKIKSMKNNSIDLNDKDGNVIKINIICGNFSLTKATYSNEFGINIATNCINVELENNLSKIEILW